MPDRKPCVHNDPSATTVQVDHGDYILAVWFCGNQTGDWMCAVMRKAGADHFDLTYRFRDRNDDIMDPRLSDDEKRVTRGCFAPEVSHHDILANVETISLMVAERYDAPVERVLVRGDSVKFARKIRRSRFARVISAGPAN